MKPKKFILVILHFYYIGICSIMRQLKQAYLIIYENRPMTEDEEIRQIFKTKKDRFIFEKEVSRMIANNIDESEIELNGKQYKISI